LYVLRSIEAPPNFKADHKCAGEFIKNKHLTPAIVHCTPHHQDNLQTKEGDSQFTMYPGQDPFLNIIRQGSKHLWANVFVDTAVKLVDSHRGNVLAEKMDFTLLALHPSSPAYHLFRQDYINLDGRPVVPFRRKTYLRTMHTVTFDAACTFSWSEDAGAHVLLKASDPRELFSGTPLLPLKT